MAQNMPSNLIRLRPLGIAHVAEVDTMKNAAGYPCGMKVVLVYRDNSTEDFFILGNFNRVTRALIKGRLLGRRITIIQTNQLIPLPTKTTDHDRMLSPFEALDALTRNLCLPEGTTMTEGLRQRPINQAHLLALIKKMERHQWDRNGANLMFDVHGNLIDGQHRCLAILLAATTESWPGVVVDIKRGCATTEIKSLDQVLSRDSFTTAHILGEVDFADTDGHRPCNQFGPASMNWLHRWATGYKHVTTDDITRIFRIYKDAYTVFDPFYRTAGSGARCLMDKRVLSAFVVAYRYFPEETVEAAKRIVEVNFLTPSKDDPLRRLHAKLILEKKRNESPELFFTTLFALDAFKSGLLIKQLATKEAVLFRYVAKKNDLIAS